MVHLARCCTPVPGDQIMGFVTQGRGVSVHRTDCSNAMALQRQSTERLIEVEWDRAADGVFVATIEVLAFDREAPVGREPASYPSITSTSSRRGPRPRRTG